MIKKVKKQIRDVKFKLKSFLTLISHNSLLHRINVAVNRRVKVILTRYLNKLSNLHKKRSGKNVNHTSLIKNTVYNMSPYSLTENEYNALAF